MIIPIVLALLVTVTGPGSSTQTVYSVHSVETNGYTVTEKILVGRNVYSIPLTNAYMRSYLKGLMIDRTDEKVYSDWRSETTDFTYDTRNLRLYDHLLITNCKFSVTMTTNLRSKKKEIFYSNEHDLKLIYFSNPFNYSNTGD